MSSFSDMINRVAGIKVDKPDNPYASVNNTTVPLADIISINSIYLQHDKEQKEKDAEIARLTEQVLSSSDMDTVTTQMQENINSLNKRLEEMAKQLAEKVSDDKVDSDKYNDLKSKYDNLEKSYNDIQTQKSELEKVHNESLEEEKELSTTVDALTKDVDDLKLNNDELTAKNEDAIAKYDKLKGDYDQCKTDYDALNLEFEKLKNEPNANVELTVDYIKSKGFTYVDFMDGNTRKFFDSLITIIKPDTFNNEVSLQANIRGLLDRLVFVVLSDYVEFIKGADYYNKGCTSAEFFYTAMDVICKGYTGSDMEKFIFRPFALHYSFEDMTELDAYLKNRGMVIDNNADKQTEDDNNTGNTEITDTPVDDTIGDNSDTDDTTGDTEVVATDDNSALTPVVNTVFDEDHISQIVYDAVLQCFNDCEFDTNINYITKIVAFACASSLHLTPFSCPGYFDTYNDKRNVAITADIMETMLKGIFREKLERIKPVLGDEDATLEQEVALRHMNELDEEVVDILSASEEHLGESFFDNYLGDDLY